MMDDGRWAEEEERAPILIIFSMDHCRPSSYRPSV